MKYEIEYLNSGIIENLEDKDFETLKKEVKQKAFDEDKVILLRAVKENPFTVKYIWIFNENWIYKAL